MKTLQRANATRLGGMIVVLIGAELIAFATGWMVGPLLTAGLVLLLGVTVGWLALTAGAFWTLGQMAQIEAIGFENKELDPR